MKRLEDWLGDSPRGNFVWTLLSCALFCLAPLRGVAPFLLFWQARLWLLLVKRRETKFCYYFVALIALDSAMLLWDFLLRLRWICFA